MSQQSEQWSCGKCTYQQSSTAPHCEICKNPNPFVVRHTSQSQKSQKSQKQPSTVSALDKIDIALNNHYISLGRSDYFDQYGNGKFSAFCEEEGFEEENIVDELDGEAEDCGFLEFDHNFPYSIDYKNKHENLKQIFIFDFIKKSYHSPIQTLKKKPKTSYNNYTEQESKQSNVLYVDGNDSNQPSEMPLIPQIPQISHMSKKKSMYGASAQEICNALKRYYKIMNRPYNKLFAEHCIDNGVTSISEELQSDPSYCILVDFDPDFPFRNELCDANETVQRQFIFDLIYSCFNNPFKQFDPTLPQCFFSTTTLKYLYTITRQEYEHTRQLYEKQCGALWYAGGMETDNCFSYAVAIGLKHKFNYLQYLVDDYHRASIRHSQIQHGALTVGKWSRNHSHFKALKNITFVLPWKKQSNKQLNKTNEPQNAFDIATHAIHSFNARCVPKLQINNILSIDDSLEIVARYIASAAGFVRALLKKSKARNMPICPFQIDFCIGYAKSCNQDKMMRKYKLRNNDDDDDDSDDDDDDDIDYDEKYQKNNAKKEEKYVDIIGDIKGKLDANNIKYCLGSEDPTRMNDFEYMSWRGLEKLFEEFIQEHNLLSDKGKKRSPEMYLHNKRLIIFVDRRQNTILTQKQTTNTRDDIWLYEAPINCRDIPHNAVPEWHISASKTCILPDMEYGDGKQAEQAINTANIADKAELKDEKDKISHANIGASFHCKGQVLTVSFVANESDAIKSYLYWNGQMSRFFATDLKTVLTGIMNMKWNNGFALKVIRREKLAQEIEKSAQYKVWYEKSENERFAQFKDTKYEKKDEANDLDAIVNRMQKCMKDIYIDPFS